MADTPIKTTQEEVSNPLQKALSFLAYPIALAAGIFAGHTHSRNRTYESLKSQGFFEQALKDKTDSFNTLKAEVETYKQAVTAGRTDVEKPNAPRKRGTINRTYDKATRTIMREEGYTFTHHHLMGLSMPEILETAALAFGAASVALGVTTAIADSKVLKEKFSHHNTQDQGRQ